jgi:hypothetical protein
MAFLSACVLLVGLAVWRAVLEQLIGPIRLP